MSKLKYKSTNSSGFETAAKSRILIHGIQEWFDSNYDGLMQDSEKVATLYFIGENHYEPITSVGPDNYDVYDINISETRNGYLTMIAHMTSNFTNYYEPNSMKFDIIIQKWIYKNNENQFAILMEYRTESEMETDDERYIEQKTISPSIGYSALIWNTTFVTNDLGIGSISAIRINAIELNRLIGTDDEYEGEQTIGMWFCFSSKGADKIFWDPNPMIGLYTTLPSYILQSAASVKNSLFSHTIAGVVAISIMVR